MYKYILLIFIILNTFKVLFFQLEIVSGFGLKLLLFKLFMNLFLITAIYTILFKLNKRRFFVGFYILQLVYMLSNYIYYSYFKTYLHLNQSFYMFSEGTELIRNFSIPLNAKMIVFFIDLPAIIIIFFKYDYFENIIKKIRGRNLVFFLAFLVFVMFVIESTVMVPHIKFFNDRFTGEHEYVKYYGVLINNFVKLIDYNTEKKIIENFSYGKDIKVEKATSNNPNFIIIQVESLDASIINFKYKGEEVTPFFNYLSQNSIFYRYNLSHHYVGTLDTEFLAINSVEPSKNYPTFKLNNYTYPNSLANIMNKKYKMEFFHNNKLSFFNRNVAYKKMGFENLNGLIKMQLEEVGWGAPDDEMFNYILRNNDSSTPFFKYIVTMSSHYPFNLVYKYGFPLKFKAKSRIVEDYFNSIYYVDETIKDFFNKIRLIYPNTYIIIYGDHTAVINDEEYSSSIIEKDGIKLEFVPLFIITPDNEKYIEQKYVTSFFDVAPSILYHSGLSFSYKSNGQDIISHNLKDDYIEIMNNKYLRSELFKMISKD